MNGGVSRYKHNKISWKFKLYLPRDTIRINVGRDTARISLIQLYHLNFLWVGRVKNVEDGKSLLLTSSALELKFRSFTENFAFLGWTFNYNFSELRWKLMKNFLNFSSFIFLFSPFHLSPKSSTLVAYFSAHFWSLATIARRGWEKFVFLSWQDFPFNSHNKRRITFLPLMWRELRLVTKHSSV